MYAVVMQAVDVAMPKAVFDIAPLLGVERGGDEVGHIGGTRPDRHRLIVHDNGLFAITTGAEQHVVEAEIAVYETRCAAVITWQVAVVGGQPACGGEGVGVESVLVSGDKTVDDRSGNTSVQRDGGGIGAAEPVVVSDVVDTAPGRGVQRGGSIDHCGDAGSAARRQLVAGLTVVDIGQHKNKPAVIIDGRVVALGLWCCAEAVKVEVVAHLSAVGVHRVSRGATLRFRRRQFHDDARRQVIGARGRRDHHPDVAADLSGPDGGAVDVSHAWTENPVQPRHRDLLAAAWVCMRCHLSSLLHRRGAVRCEWLRLTRMLLSVIASPSCARPLLCCESC